MSMDVFLYFDTHSIKTKDGLGIILNTSFNTTYQVLLNPITIQPSAKLNIYSLNQH